MMMMMMMMMMITGVIMVIITMYICKRAGTKSQKNTDSSFCLKPDLGKNISS